MKKVLIIFILFFLTISFGNQALACSCTEPIDAEDAYLQADVIFTGIVTSFYDREGSENIYKDAEIVVYDLFKGNENNPRTVIVGTNAFGAACGYTFIEGQEYLVYATIARDGKMYTESCGRTKLISSAGDEIELLFELQKESENTNSGSNVKPAVPPENGEWELGPQPQDVFVTPESIPSSNSSLVIGMIVIGVIGIGLLVGTIFYFARKK
jgi:hypothetical protein